MTEQTTTGALATATDGVLTWRCTVCGSTIDAGAGGFILKHGDVERARAAARARHIEDARIDALPPAERIEARIYTPGAAVNAVRSRMYYRAPWKLLHFGCASDDDVIYDVEVQRARTAAELLDWTAHFDEKGWLSLTSWAETVLRHAHRALGTDA
ncbi:hypothetical protein [Gordonia amarae]|uniref:hypothetical protein n=1 Tax=Gordonia amarae TaxID=36821 RepID=UPI001AF2C2CE|nr:hypothetical protein [Gordonia amarae]QHN17935.1 hypothetical protein GII35_14055 [Gordonia amarae]QHN22456.1 hypothetical protein GII34_13800 [Gordonia amarae]